MAKTLKETLERFGFATVIEPTFYAVGDTELETPLLSLDSLRISNITQEGPTKEAKGGLHAKTQMRYGKTMRLEMEDVVGRVDVMERLMGAKLVGSPGDITRIQFTDKFAEPVQIIGKTFVIDSNDGEKEWVKIHIKKFRPDSVFEMTMEAEGDFGAMNIAGEIFPDKCGVFYSIELATGPTCPIVEA